MIVNQAADWISNVSPAFSRRFKLSRKPTIVELIEANGVSVTEFSVAVGVPEGVGSAILLGHEKIPDTCDFDELARLLDTDYVAAFILAETHNKKIHT